MHRAGMWPAGRQWLPISIGPGAQRQMEGCDNKRRITALIYFVPSTIYINFKCPVGEKPLSLEATEECPSLPLPLHARRLQAVDRKHVRSQPTGKVIWIDKLAKYKFVD